MSMPENNHKISCSWYVKGTQPKIIKIYDFDHQMCVQTKQNKKL